MDSAYDEFLDTKLQINKAVLIFYGVGNNMNSLKNFRRVESNPLYPVLKVSHLV